MPELTTGGHLADAGFGVANAFAKDCTPDAKHQQRTCPRCGTNCSTVGLTRLAYTFETCECSGPHEAGQPYYAHLVEQLWHRKCLGAEVEG